MSGGDIRNAVLKAALAAAARPGPDSSKRIHQRDLEAGIESVLAGKQVMRQSLFTDADATREQMLLSDVSGSRRLIVYAIALGAVAFLVAVLALLIAALK